MGFSCSAHTQDGHPRSCSCACFPPVFAFCQPWRGSSVCKQLMLRWHFHFLHENHLSVPGSSETVLNRGRSLLNKGSVVSLLFSLIPWLWLHLHCLWCLCQRMEIHGLLWSTAKTFPLFRVKLSLLSSFSPFLTHFNHLSLLFGRGWTQVWSWF